MFFLERIFNFICCWNKIIGSEILNGKKEKEKGILPWLVNYLTTQCPSLIYFLSSLSFTHVLHIYPMSKWLNELNIINLNLYIFHMLIPWGVMTSHIGSRGGKFTES